MVNPNKSGMPGTGQMADTFEFMKNLWGSMGVPGMPGAGTTPPPGMNFPSMAMPTLSVEEINKKITDLRAVESWLTLNMHMLRGTIQALEVQSATIAALQSMGETLSSAVASAGNVHAASGGQQDGVSGAAKKSSGAPEPTSEDSANAAAFAAPFVNAAAWWNMLQDQFKQAVNHAMTETQADGNATAHSNGSDAKPAEKPQAESAPKRKSPRS